MSERKIAEDKVKPYLIKLGFSEDLISDYDSVLVQFGTSTGRVDYVCYHVKGDLKLPFLVVEVKTSQEKMDPVQAESYAQRLDAPFFALTDGDDWHWFLTGKGQSNSTRLKYCPLPLVYQKAIVKKIEIEQRKDIFELVALYENKMKTDAGKCPVGYNSCSFMKRPYNECEGCLVWNVVWINWTLKELSKMYANFESMSASQLANILGSRDVLWSVYPQNSKLVSEWVLSNIKGAKETIAYLMDEKSPVENRFNNIVSGDYHIPGIGPFLASMLIAGIDREKYTIISNTNLGGLLRLGLIEIQPLNVTGIDYVNFNKIMLKLSQIFKDSLRLGRTALVHDFTLLVGGYLDTGRWRG